MDVLRQQRIRQLEERLKAGGAWEGNDPDLVFTTPTGRPVNGSWLTHRFQRTLRREGLPFQPFHSTRHAAASFAIAQGIDIRTVQELLGHASYATTANVYGHLTTEATRQATVKIGALLAGS